MVHAQVAAPQIRGAHAHRHHALKLGRLPPLREDVALDLRRLPHR